MATYRTKLTAGLWPGEVVFDPRGDIAVADVHYEVWPRMVVTLANGRVLHCRYDQPFLVVMPNRRMCRWRFDRTK
jgi:hypothetical protein